MTTLRIAFLASPTEEAQQALAQLTSLHGTSEPDQADVLCASPADPDVLLVFQQYRDAAAAQEFLGNPAYLAYLAESGGLLAGPPEVEPVESLWSKVAGPGG